MFIIQLTYQQATMPVAGAASNVDPRIKRRPGPIIVNIPCAGFELSWRTVRVRILPNIRCTAGVEIQLNSGNTPSPLPVTVDKLMRAHDPMRYFDEPTRYLLKILNALKSLLLQKSRDRLNHRKVLPLSGRHRLGNATNTTAPRCDRVDSQKNSLASRKRFSKRFARQFISFAIAEHRTDHCTVGNIDV